MHCICSYNTYFSLIATPDMHVILRLEASLEYNATFCTFFFSSTNAIVTTLIANP